MCGKNLKTSPAGTYARGKTLSKLRNQYRAGAGLVMEETSIVTRTILVLFAGSFVIQSLYWILVFARIPLWHPGKPGTRRFPVSIVICTKNEEENLRANLPLFLSQDHPDYEVLVVDDASNDGTQEVLRDLQRVYPHLRTTAIRENVHIRQGKKLALTVGIKGAANEWLLLTDADCRPASRQWLRNMQQNFSRECHIVLGFGKYESKKGLLNILIRYDTLFTALQYLGFALARLPYMGVGRNLAYRKSLFFKNRGFARHYDLASGDDDLFINEVARGKNTRIEIRPESHTVSTPEKNWHNWYHQKRRHLTTGPRYRLRTKILLGGELSSRMVFYLALILLLSKAILLPWILCIFFIRLLVTGIVVKLAMRRLNEKYLLLPSPILDFALLWIQVFMVFSNYVAAKRSRWK